MIEVMYQSECSMEVVSLNVRKYFNGANEHTCAVDFRTGKVCAFFATIRFGVDEVCMLNAHELLNRGLSKEGEYGGGYLIPHKNCPIKTARKTFKEGEEIESDPVLRRLD